MIEVGKGTDGGWVVTANVVGHGTTGTLISPVLTVVEVVEVGKVVLVEVLEGETAAVSPPPPQLATDSERTKIPTP